MLTGLLIVLLVVVALLSMPLELDFRVEWPDGARNEVVLVWAFGLVRARMPTGGSGKNSSPNKKSRDRNKRGRDKSGNVLAAVRQRPFRQRVYRFVKDLWRSIIKENMHVRARVGLGDPADTGQLWAIVGPVAGMLAGAKEASVVIEPDFVDAVFELDSSGRLQLVPLHVIAISMGLLFSPALWRGLRAMRAA